jgi:hypothetical protein
MNESDAEEAERLVRAKSEEMTWPVKCTHCATESVTVCKPIESVPYVCAPCIDIREQRAADNVRYTRELVDDSQERDLRQPDSHRIPKGWL